MPQLGVGLDLRLGALTLHPEVTALVPVADDVVSVLYFAGLGFVFGAAPNFSDLN